MENFKLIRYFKKRGLSEESKKYHLFCIDRLIFIKNLKN